MIKRRNHQEPKGGRFAALCALFLSALALSGCNSTTLQEFVRGPDLERVGTMEHEPITRLAFVPINEDAGKIKLVIERPVKDTMAQDMAAIETASGEARKGKE